MLLYFHTNKTTPRQSLEPEAGGCKPKSLGNNMIAQVTKTVTTTASGWAILDLPGAELIPLHRQVSLVSRCLGWNEKSMAQDLALGNLGADWFEDLALDQLELGEDQHHTGNRAVAIILYAHLERLSWAWGDLAEDVKLSPTMELDRLGVDADTFWGINDDVTEAWEGAKQYFAEVWGL